jgi:arylsulfatase A-like enzyme
MLPRKQLPNIIVIILDAVRARNVSSYGYPSKTTPYLDEFAAEGLRFRHAFSTSTWTIPTHASILSGLYLSQHRIETVKANRKFNQAIVTLPVALRAHGYRTAAFSQNILFSPQHHFDDFGEFHLGNEARIIKRNGSVSLLQKMAKYRRKVKAPRNTFGSMIKWIEKCDGPLFIMANITNAHYPWALPLPDLIFKSRVNPIDFLDEDLLTLQPFQFNSGKRSVTARHRIMWQTCYDVSIRHLDREIGRFLRRLKQWKGWSNTIVAITADHGEMLGDYRDIVGHTLSLHDNLIRVPLIVRHPDYPSNLVVQGVVQIHDLYSSIFEWIGAATDSVPHAQLQRPSLSQAVTSANEAEGFAFAEEDYTDSYDVIRGLLGANPGMNPTKYPRQQIAVRSATHKYIWFDDRPGEFYNLIKDPFEEIDLTSVHDPSEGEMLKELQSALQAWRSNLEIFPPQSTIQEVEVNPEVADRLRELGYIE